MEDFRDICFMYGTPGRHIDFRDCPGRSGTYGMSANSEIDLNEWKSYVESNPIKMERRVNSGDRKLSIATRPKSGSKQRKPARRRYTPTSNAVVFPSTPKRNQPSHSSTNFPLFSDSALIPSPSISQTAKLKQVSSRNRQSITHSHSHNASKNGTHSPTPVEETPRSGCGRRMTLRSDPSRQCTTRYNDTAPHRDCVSPSLSTYSHDSSLSYTSEDIFPFQYLPDDCKLKVFSYLTSHDKGRCAQVCSSWWALIQTPGVWSHVSLSDFPFWCITTDEHNCLGNCYIRYRVRVKQFLAYLKDRRPILRSLEFKFDIGEHADGYLQPLQSFVDKSNTKELKYASINWKETPMRPFWTNTTGYIQIDEVMQKHRVRQRLFLGFFELFTNKCPKLETLILPFDWSEKSVECLLKLKTLKSLVIEKYYVFQKLRQELIDRTLQGLPFLKQLMLEVWTPSGHGLVFFSLNSKSLEYLDISQSRGFYLCDLNLPGLKVFRVARHPWNGPLVLTDRISVPCLYDVLAEGAPNLEKINEHNLKTSWKEQSYHGLDEVLKSVCSCKKHKYGWAM